MTIIPHFVWFEAGGARSLFDRIGSQKSQFLNYSRVMINLLYLGGEWPALIEMRVAGVD
jgi:hypothetical protein